MVQKKELLYPGVSRSFAFSKTQLLSHLPGTMMHHGTRRRGVVDSMPL